MKRYMAIAVILLAALGTSHLLSGLELNPEKGTEASQNPKGNFDPDTTYIRKDRPADIRVLTVNLLLSANESIKEGSIKHSSDIGSVWTPGPTEDQQVLSAEGKQNPEQVGSFSKTISGTIITTLGKGEGKGTPPPLPPPWDFSGTGKYNIIHCNFKTDSDALLGTNCALTGTALTRGGNLINGRYLIPLTTGTVQDFLRSILQTLSGGGNFIEYGKVIFPNKVEDVRIVELKKQTKPLNVQYARIKL